MVTTRVQAGHGDGHEALHGCLGGKAPRRRQGVEAVAGELVGRNVVAHDPALGPLGEDVPDQFADLIRGARHLAVTVQEALEVGVVVPPGSLREKGVGLEQRPKAVPRLGSVGSKNRRGRPQSEFAKML